MTNLSLTEAVDQLREYAADEVAALMTAAGIKGEPQEPKHCPLAHWFNRVVDDHPQIYVEESYVSDVDGLFDYRLPIGVRLFIEAFDQGAYPDLVQRVWAS